MTKKPWKQSMNLPSDSTRVVVYCKETDKEKWAEEATEKGYKSRSTYLYELIHEARAYREKGFLAHHRSEERIKELEAEISRLEDKIEQQKQNTNTGHLSGVQDVDLRGRFLTHQYQSLNEITTKILESGVLKQAIRKPVEDELYRLASQNQARYERGHGWKLTDNRGDQ